MTRRRRYDLVLSVYLTARGMAWVLFEGPYAPFDWSVLDLRGMRKSHQCMERYLSVLQQYSPDVIVLEDTSRKLSSRSQRIKTLNERFRGLAVGLGFSVARFTRADITRAFANIGIVNKDTIAQEIAQQIPCMRQHLPPRRKPWMSEDPRMGLFDATALALLFYQQTMT